jgi:hypothetical protein
MVTRIERIGRALAQAFHAVDTNRRVRLAKGLYFQVPKLKLNLVWGIGGESQSAELSIPEARMIFQSMKSAHELRERHQVEVGDLVWTIDGRVQANNPDEVIIHFKSPSGSLHTVLRRENVSAALAEFESKLFSAL